MQDLRHWLPDEVTFRPTINHSTAAQSALRHSLEKLGMSSKAISSQSAQTLCLCLLRLSASVSVSVCEASVSSLVRPTTYRSPVASASASARIVSRQPRAGKTIECLSVGPPSRRSPLAPWRCLCLGFPVTAFLLLCFLCLVSVLCVCHPIFKACVSAALLS